MSVLVALLVAHASAQYTVGVVQVDVNGADLTLSVTGPSGDTLLNGNLGMTLTSDVTNAECTSEEDGVCLAFSNGWTLNVQEHPTIPGCSRILWETSDLTEQLQDCFTLDADTHMYGGGEQSVQHWAVEGYDRTKVPVVTEYWTEDFGALVERYWLFSNGALINADFDTPLWFNLTASTRTFCFFGQNEAPYALTEDAVSAVEMRYTVCTADNVKDAHILWISANDIRPDGVSDETMIVYPDWSTWVPYGEGDNQQDVLEFAQNIIAYNLPASQVEIDDGWETCSGEQVFDTSKFPNITELVQTLKAMGHRVTLWIHPFLNNDCPTYQWAANNSYLVKTSDGSVGPVTWWDSGTGQSSLIDFTNDEAREWWSNRLATLQSTYGFDSFKFDAGETYYLPADYVLNSNINRTNWPSAWTESYIGMLSNFGNMVETRSGCQTYRYNIFRRMLDKDSVWTYDNGLQTMIPSTLFSGIVGYVHVLPDMVGGNQYGEITDSELFLRWMEVNVFLPSLQFSIPPWTYDNATVDTVRDMLSLRASYGDYIIQLYEEAASNGYPIVRPLWWIAPTDNNTFANDNEFLLGDDMLVAPVLTQGATTRDIYLPEGTWYDVMNNVNITGPTTLTDYQANIDQLPYFLRADSSLVAIALK